MCAPVRTRENDDVLGCVVALLSVPIGCVIHEVMAVECTLLYSHVQSEQLSVQYTVLRDTATMMIWMLCLFQCKSERSSPPSNQTGENRFDYEQSSAAAAALYQYLLLIPVINTT